MSRDSSGTYTLPAGNPVVSATTIQASWANTTMDDLASSLTNSLSRTGKGGMLAALKLLAGTAADPSLTFTVDPTTGLYRVAAGEIGFASGGSLVATLTALGLEIPAAPTVGNHAVNKTYADAGDAAVQANLDAHAADAVDAHDASAISNVPAGNIVATDVQAALNELDTEKVTVSFPRFTANAINVNDSGFFVTTSGGGASVPVGKLTTSDILQIGSASLANVQMEGTTQIELRIGGTDQFFFTATGLAVDGQVTINDAAPTAADHATRKDYVDAHTSWLGWQLADGFYTELSKSVASEETSVADVFFKPDGTKMYICGSNVGVVHQYGLSTAWDLSTASYDSKSKNVSTEDADPRGVFFKPDGTKMYVLGENSNTVYQYSLSTAWDVSTASYDSKSKSVATEDTVPEGVFFKPDGTKMYMIGGGTDDVYPYSLSTAWDVSTASYDSVSYAFTAETTTPSDVFFNPDGTKMYIASNGNNKVFQYSLSTAWNVTTATYDTVSFDTSAQGLGLTGISISSDGTKMYGVIDGNDTVYHYSIGKPFKLT